MTKDEAITAVKEVTGMSLPWDNRHYEALQMAIEALNHFADDSKKVSAEGQDSISRQMAISHVDDVPYIKEHPNVGLLWKAWIESLPAAQPKRTQERTETHSCDLRRYTLGNDEFSLEAAYHDCKLVFDGITDDDSFQEADTGLILYYANEIIYALHEALEGKGTNVLSNDCISREAAIDALERIFDRCEEIEAHLPENDPDRVGYKMYPDWLKVWNYLRQLPSAEPEIIRCRDCKYFAGEGMYCGQNICVQFDHFYCYYGERKE